MRKKKNIIEEVKESARTEEKKPSEFMLVKTGSTIMDLACSDSLEGGFQTGTIVHIVGDSSSGKTFSGMTCFAEVGNDPRFDDYKLINDDAEHRNNFNIEKLFGKKIADRIEPPFGYDDDGSPINSEMIEDFQDSVYGLLEDGVPFIYILDSMDSLDAVDDVTKFEATMAARQKIRDTGEAKKVPGTYGMAKAKSNSEVLRRIKGKVRKTRSLIIVISQTRSNIGLGFAEKTVSGGKALKFYATHQIWMAVKAILKKSDLPIGVKSQLKIKKNSLTGKHRQIEFDIFYDYGIDDIGSMIDFLISLKIWKKVKASYIIPEFDITCTRAKFIDLIESEEANLTKLKNLTKRNWQIRERSLRLGRKKRFN